MKSNANLVDLIEKVKPEIRTLIEKCNTVSCRSDPPLKRVACSGPLIQSAFFPFAGQNVGPAAHPQDRGRQQLRGVHPGGDGSRAQDGGRGSSFLPRPDLEVIVNTCLSPTCFCTLLNTFASQICLFVDIISQGQSWFPK